MVKPISLRLRNAEILAQVTGPSLAVSWNEVPGSRVGLMRMLAVAKCRLMAILRSEIQPDCAALSRAFFAWSFPLPTVREGRHRGASGGSGNELNTARTTSALAYFADPSRTLPRSEKRH